MHNKAFKSDSQRLAVSLRSNIAKRRSHLNAALYAFEVLETKWIFSLSKRSSCISMKYVKVKRILSA
ncbi:hypothetical protein CGK39_23200 [Vibrio parahaemolyticus]|nr:hypothetical protein CGK39_23200 [Vibrio parahaemolyticus]TPA03723.1 hypothetical protein DXE03_24575 [Vibrio parahaemolyticus]